MNVRKEDHQEIWDTLSNVERALVEKDATAFDKLLSTDFVGASPTGASFGKSAYINHHCNNPFGVMAVVDEGMEAASIRVYQNTAVVNRRVHAHFKFPAGNITEYDVQRIEVLIKQDDQWQMVSGQGTQVMPLIRTEA